MLYRADTVQKVDLERNKFQFMTQILKNYVHELSAHLRSECLPIFI